MKKAKKLLCTLIALLLVFCSLSSVMTVGATNKKCDYKAFSSVKVGKKKLDMKEAAEEGYGDIILGRKTKKAKVQVKLKKGWKLKKIIYYNGARKTTVKNGGTIKPNSDTDSYLRIKAVNGKKTATIEFSVFNDFDED